MENRGLGGERGSEREKRERERKREKRLREKIAATAQIQNKLSSEDRQLKLSRNINLILIEMSL